MKRRICFVAAPLLWGALFSLAAFAQEEPSGASLAEVYGAPGPFEVETQLEDWRDAERERVVPVKLYIPKTDAAPWPIVLMSHGLGGSREVGQYLGSHWASHGYFCVFLQHPGSDTPTIKDSMAEGENFRDAMREAMAPANALTRIGDAHFAIDELERQNAAKDSPWRGKLDLERIGMSGHSFGAGTTLSIAGQMYITARGRAFGRPDRRVKAVIPMSAPTPDYKIFLNQVYGRIVIPCLHMTGTLDASPLDPEGSPAEKRRIPFDNIWGIDQYLLTFAGGDHMVFSGRGLRQDEPRPKDPVFHRLIQMSSAAFWDAYLRGNKDAEKWLKEGGFAATLGEEGVFEVKTADAQETSLEITMYKELTK